MSVTRIVDRYFVNGYFVNSYLSRWAILLVTAAIVFTVGVIKPMHNWDMIGYVASSYYEDGYRDNELVQLTYDDVRQAVGEAEFEVLTLKGPDAHYRATVYQDPRALTQQIPFYSIRVVYVGLMRLIKHFGIEYASATYLISSFFAASAVLLFGRILLSYGVPVFYVPLIVLSTGYTDLARLSTADAMACFFSLLAAYAFLKRSILFFLVVALLPLVRTDFVLLSCLMLAASYFRGEKLQSVIVLLVSLLAYFAVNKLKGNYGWLTVLNFTLIDMSPYPVDLVPSHNILKYIKLYLKVIADIFMSPHSAIYIFLSYQLAVQWRKINRDAAFFMFCVIPVIFVALHLLLFPVYMDRFFVFSSSLMFVWLLGSMRGITDKRMQDCTTLVQS